MKTKEELKTAQLKKFKSQTDKIFSQFNAELKKKKATLTADINKIFTPKYSSKIEKATKDHRAAMAKIG
jgi:hypothetical protein